VLTLKTVPRGQDSHSSVSKLKYSRAGHVVHFPLLTNGLLIGQILVWGSFDRLSFILK